MEVRIFYSIVLAHHHKFLFSSIAVKQAPISSQPISGAAGLY
jgi:hypothetical protein